MRAQGLLLIWMRSLWICWMILFKLSRLTGKKITMQCDSKGCKRRLTEDE